MEKNCYSLSKQWKEFVITTDEMVRPIHTALYSVIVQKNNELHWKDVFGLPNYETMKAVPIKGYRHYKNALNDLIKWGFITLVSRSINQHSSNQISLNLPSTKSIGQNNLLSTKGTEQSDLPSTKGTKQPILPSTKGHYNKQEYKQEKNKTDFDFFKKLFEFKENPKCEDLWNKLSESDKTDIIKNLPYYILNKSDRKFRHSPENFLKNRIWEQWIDPCRPFVLNGVGYNFNLKNGIR